MEDAPRCDACGRAGEALVAHSGLERVRHLRNGAPAAPEPGYVKAELVERSPRWSMFLVERRLCPACLAAAREAAEDQDSRLRRLTLGAAVAALLLAAVSLAFPSLWPELARMLALRPADDSRLPAPASTPYKPPFPAAMPTGNK